MWSRFDGRVNTLLKKPFMAPLARVIDASCWRKELGAVCLGLHVQVDMSSEFRANASSHTRD
jgi:hypothetical protein